jgi:hypothetical protein
MTDSLLGCELPCSISTLKKWKMLKSLVRLDVLPVVVGVGAAAVGIILTPIIAPAVLSMLGFGAAGPIAGKYKSKIPTLPHHRLHKTERFRIN